MNTGTFILVIVLVATSVIVANHIITKRNAENQRIQNAAFIAAQRAELKKKEEEIKKTKEKDLQNEVKISSWETLNTKPPEIINRIQEEILQSNPPQSRPINVKHVDKLWAAEQTDDDVNLAKNLFSVVKDETDEEESLYSYQNLTHAHTLSRREMLPVRDAWSRADNTNPALWESQVQFMRDEIKASGQTLEEFRENTLMPLPEQFTALWKSAEEEPVKKSKDLSIPKPPPKHAVAEAASLVRDATQYVHFENSDLASQSMIEIAKAIKRSSALGVTLPSLPQSTADAVKKWSESDDELAKQAALALVNII
jgi:Tfp pilus assembly protein PilX